TRRYCRRRRRDSRWPAAVPTAVLRGSPGVSLSPARSCPGWSRSGPTCTVRAPSTRRPSVTPYWGSTREAGHLIPGQQQHGLGQEQVAYGAQRQAEGTRRESRRQPQTPPPRPEPIALLVEKAKSGGGPLSPGTVGRKKIRRLSLLSN